MMKKTNFFKKGSTSIISLVLMFFLNFSAFSQQNLAPLATVTASNCQGACSVLNDLNFGTCGIQQMWISTTGPPSTTIGTDFIEWNFPSVQSFDSLIIHGNGSLRTLTGGTVQFWDGTQWVTHITFNNTVQQCISRNGIGKLTTDRFRITAFQMTGQGQNSNPSLREIEILQASTAPDDAGVTRIDSPSVFCPGVQNIWATIRNFGTNQIDSVNVYWELNGVVQGSYQIKGLLDTVGGLFSVDTSIFLGSHNFQSIDTIKIYTDMPNGRTDTINTNDTLVKLFGPSLSGTYTVDLNLAASATNFTSLTAMSTALTKYGICGPTIVNVATNTYVNDPIYLGNIPGSSPTNTLVIDGGDSSKVIVTNDGITEFAVLTLDGTSYTHVKNMTFKATGSSGDGIIISGAAHHDTISSCFSWIKPSANYGNWNVAFSGNPASNSSGSKAKYIVLQNNKMVGGYYGIYSYAAGAAGSLNVGNKIVNNDIDSIYYYGAYFYYQDSLEFVGNTINMLNGGNINSYGMYLYYATNVIFSSNNIIANNYAFYYYNYTTYAPRTRRTEVINNMLSSIKNVTLYMYYVDSVDFWHNSIQANGAYIAANFIGNTTVPIAGYDMRNNIFSAEDGQALVFNQPDTLFAKFDYNIFYNKSGNLMTILSGYSSLAAYQTAQPLYNTKSLQGDPNFLSKKDLHVVGNFANDVGVNLLQVTTDIDGDTRPIGVSTTVDIGADEYTPSSCPPPGSLEYSNVGYDSLTVQWIPAQTGTSFLYLLVGCGQPISSGTAVATSLDSLRIGGIVRDSCYNLYVKEVCGRGDSSIWRGPLDINTGYCVPFSLASLAYINDFYTSNGDTNISNLSSGYAVNGYSDIKVKVVSKYAGGAFDFTANTLGNQMGLSIWIDWGDDLVFDATDRVFTTTTMAVGMVNGKITIPLGTPLGNYRMRVGVEYYNASPSDPCRNTYYGEYEDYTVRVIPTPSCVEPIDLHASSIIKDSMNIVWDTLHSAISYQYIVVGCGAAPSTGTIVSTTLDSLRIGGVQIDSCYTLYVRQICAIGDTSNWTSNDISTSYCTPISNTYTGVYIDDFSTTNGNLNISNLSSGYSPNGYADNKSMAVEQYATATFDFSTVVTGFASGFAIWIDWNNNLVFDDPSEKEYVSTGSANAFSGTITVPSGTPIGDYRMRIGIDWLSSNRITPCTSGQYTEYEDYTVRVINQPSCLAPSGISTITSSATSVDLSWISTGVGANIEYGSAGFTPGNGTTVKGVSSPYTINSLLPNLAYDIYLQDSCGATDISSVAGPFKFGLDPVNCDDFDNYNTGDIASQSTLFEGWAGVPGDAEVVTTQFRSNPNALKIHDSGPSSASDLVANIGTYDSAKWVVAFDFYLPLNYGGYYNILHNYNGANSVWAIEVYLDSSGVATVQGGTNSTAIIGTYNFNKGAWNTVEHIIDLDNDTAYILVNGLSTTVGWQFSLGSGNFGNQFNGLDFYSAANSGQTPLTYYDNFCVRAFSNYPYLPIGDLNKENANGIADSLNVGAWTSGTVVGVNLNSGSGLGFTLIDMSTNTQEGIYINSVNRVSNYTVSEGDSIKVRGTVSQFNGLTQFDVDSIEVLSTGHTIPAAKLVTTLNESTESQRLEMKSYVLLDPSGTGSYNMRANNGTDTITIRVNAQTDVSDSLANINNNLLANDTICTIVGIGGQFDNSSPYTSGYQITPMYYSDLSICRNSIGLKSATSIINGISFYPNPTSGEFTITTDGLEHDNAILTVRDISGKIVVKENIANSSNAFHKTYNLSDYAKGLYLISILDGDKQINKKLILK